MKYVKITSAGSKFLGLDELVDAALDTSCKNFNAHLTKDSDKETVEGMKEKYPKSVKSLRKKLFNLMIDWESTDIQDELGN